MRVVMASSEASPLAKTGGLGDVVGALPGSLRRLGFDAAIVLPAFRGTIERAKAQTTDLHFEVPVSDRMVAAEVFTGTLADGTPVYLIRRDDYFDRDGLYGTSAGDFADNAERFVFFSRAVLALVERLGGADVLHCHDWQSALAAAFLRIDAHRYESLSRMRCVLTVHNLGYQGSFPAAAWHFLNLDAGLFHPGLFEAWGQINFLKAGLYLADALTTVSRKYAEEICTPEFGHGLDGVLRDRRGALRGILNGVDYAEWSPQTDPHLAQTYSPSDLGGKVTCKRQLQRELGLEDGTAAPLLGMVTRLADQKGLDLLLEIGPQLQARRLQLAVVGTGEPRFEHGLRQLADGAPARIAARITFDEGLAHRLQAGCDAILMPSRYEPCGLNQIYAMRYGSIPVVRATGGLDDTVEDFNPATNTGTGFKFVPYDAAALLATIDRSRGWYARRDRWLALMRNAMDADFSWDRSAREYGELYLSLVGAA